MKELKLENSNKVALVDDDDFENLEIVKWYLNPKTGYAYGYFGKNQKRLLHRVILGLSDPEQKIDHHDRCRLNCCRHNLRPCTNSQNAMNSKKKSTNKSGFKGVCWEKRYKKWRVTITKNWKHIHVGHFDFLETAAKAYDWAAKKEFGEFAVLNFPDNDPDTFIDPIVRRNKPSSSYRGVCRRGAKWIARATINGVRVHVGCFTSELDAANAVITKERAS